MSDTPDVLDALTQLIGKAIYGRWEAESLHSDSDAEVDAYVALTALTEHGYVVVKADGMSHGDELVRLGTTWSSLTGDPPPPPTYVLHRSVPENGGNHD